MTLSIVWLTTDGIFWLLIGCALIYAGYACRREHLRAPWREVLRQPIGMGAAVVLACYLVIAMLDSVHVQPAANGAASPQGLNSSELTSLLDLALGRVRTQVETTYSAPFALHGYAKESIDLPGGRSSRAYPRLAFAGTHLRDLDNRLRDILARAATGAFLGVAVWTAAAGTILAVLTRRSRAGWRSSLRQLCRGGFEIPWRTILGVTGSLCLLIGAIAALAPHYHVFGTDKVGTDVLYQALKSVRTGLIIGTLTTLVALPFALLLGIIAGYFGGWADDLIQYLYTTLSSIPGILLIAAAALILDVHMARHAEAFESLAARADLRLLALCGILGITSWTGLCRLLRAEALKLREIEFVAGARALGVSHAGILARHLVPNIMHIVLISIVLDFSGLVLAEAALTYIDIGVDPSMESWGNMINAARLELAREPVVWWSLVAAFVFMFALVLAANLFADAVRDAFDPRLRTLR